jgi:hypothetical protein
MTRDPRVYLAQILERAERIEQATRLYGVPPGYQAAFGRGICDSLFGRISARPIANSHLLLTGF